jgi:hypothetical protein
MPLTIVVTSRAIAVETRGNCLVMPTSPNKLLSRRMVMAAFSALSDFDSQLHMAVPDIEQCTGFVSLGEDSLLVSIVIRVEKIGGAHFVSCSHRQFRAQKPSRRLPA